MCSWCAQDQREARLDSAARHADGLAESADEHLHGGGAAQRTTRNDANVRHAMLHRMQDATCSMR
jgi:hypothetical protein